MGRLKKILKSGETALGTWITINHPDVVDALSDLPFDWFVFDMEHAPLEISDIEILMMPLRNTEITPLIRVPWNDMVMIKRALDIGAEGIIVPWVSSREEAEAAVKYASYPPRGLRGVGPRRCIRYGERSFLDYYSKFEGEERVIVVQIETRKALDNLEEILSTQGIDVAFVGPLDLTTNLGIPAQYDNPSFKEALEKILKTCREYDVAPGIYAVSLKNAEEMISKGFRFVSLMSDMRILKSGYEEALKKFGRK